MKVSWDGWLVSGSCLHSTTSRDSARTRDISKKVELITEKWYFVSIIGHTGSSVVMWWRTRKPHGVSLKWSRRRQSIWTLSWFHIIVVRLDSNFECAYFSIVLLLSLSHSEFHYANRHKAFDHYVVVDLILLRAHHHSSIWDRDRERKVRETRVIGVIETHKERARLRHIAKLNRKTYNFLIKSILSIFNSSQTHSISPPAQQTCHCWPYIQHLSSSATTAHQYEVPVCRAAYRSSLQALSTSPHPSTTHSTSRISKSSLVSVVSRAAFAGRMNTSRSIARSVAATACTDLAWPALAHAVHFGRAILCWWVYLWFSLWFPRGILSYRLLFLYLISYDRVTLFKVQSGREPATICSAISTVAKLKPRVG